MFGFANRLRSTRSNTRSVVFHPAQLPCAFGINLHSEEYSKGKLYDVYNQSIYRNGKNTLDAYYDTSAAKVTTVRFDQMEQGLVPLYHGEKEETSTCQGARLAAEAVEERIKEALGFFLEDMTFDGVNASSFKGKKCNLYYVTMDDKVRMHLYADSDNFIIGVTGFNEEEQVSMIAEVSYDFKFSLDLFAQSRTSFPGCDDAAYTVPKDQC